MDTQQNLELASERALELIRARIGPPDNRWLRELSELLQWATFFVPDEQVTSDPLGMPYFQLHLTNEGLCSRWTTIDSLMDHLVENMLGAMIFADGKPKLSLSHGHILSWRLYGNPYPPRFWNAPDDQTGPKKLSRWRKLVVGVPNEQMMPPIVRSVLRKVMRRGFDIAEPRVGLVRLADSEDSSRIVFDLSPTKFGGIEEGFRAYQILVWHMPYCIPSWYVPTLAGSSWMTPL